MSRHGQKPQLKWLPVGSLSVDPRYQRGLDSKRSKRLILHIADDFRWSRFGAALVPRNGVSNDAWLILDGQHRVEAARRAGIGEVPCVIVGAESVAEQAAAFVGANRDRVAVNPYALHHAMVAAGDAPSVALDALCRRSGIEIPRYPIPRSSLKPGQTLALGTLARLLRDEAGEGGHLRFTLEALVEASGEEAGRLGAALIRAAHAVLAPPHGNRRERLIAVLREYEQAVLDAMVLDFRIDHPGTREADALQSILLDLIAGRAPATRRRARVA